MLHLVIHWALHLAGDAYKTIVRAYYYDIAFGKTDVASHFAVEYIVVDIDSGYLTVVAEYLDVTERTDAVCSACHI